MRRAKIAPTLIVVEQPAAPAKSSQAGSSSSVPSRLRKVTFEEPPPTEVTSPTSNVPGSRNPRSNVDSSPNNQLELAVLPGRISAYLDTISSSVSDPNAPLQPITSNEFPADSQFIDPLPVDQFPLVNRQPPNAASTSNAASSSTSSSGRSISTRSSSSRSSSDLSRRYSSNIRPTRPSVFLTSGQASLFQALFSLTQPDDSLPAPGLPHSDKLPSEISYGPSWPSPNLGSQIRDEEPAANDADDPEFVKQVICRAPTPDANVRSNALPFVLQSYARWVNFTVFDPLRVIHLIRENLIAQFAASEASRSRVILIANVIGTLGKSPELNARGLSIVAYLRTEAHQAITRFHSGESGGQREQEMREAAKTLDHMIEMILIQRFTSPLATVQKLMEDAAPVFRKACFEPPEQLVSLPNILLEPGLNLRNFAATDVIMSVTTGRPMLFKYDVTYTPEMSDQMMNGAFGLQWLHGVPDQFIILLASINSLYEDFGSSVDPEFISQIEDQIRDVKITPPTPSADPIFTVWRLVVQECWRQTVYIYLYMVLCEARADDPRVLRAVRAFTRLMDGVKPGRNPDAFLFIPIMIAGASVYHDWDRNIIRRRMLGLRECTNPGTCGHECLSILVDVWERTEAENRPAVRSDVRLAYIKVAGV